MTMNRDNLTLWLERLSMFAVILSVAVIILLTVQSLDPRLLAVLVGADAVLGWFFVAEYVTRLGATQAQGPSPKAASSYALSFFGVIDLLTILPVVLPFFFGSGLASLKALRMFRLLRVLKLVRHNQSMLRLGKVIASIRPALATTFFMTMLIVVITSIFMFQIEHEAQPEAFPNVIATFWWAITTLTTVGYGDVYPVTVAGKIFSALLSLLGIGIVAIPTGLISAAYVQELEE